jgi:hypothetical protein
MTDDRFCGKECPTVGEGPRVARSDATLHAVIWQPSEVIVAAAAVVEPLLLCVKIVKMETGSGFSSSSAIIQGPTESNTMPVAGLAELMRRLAPLLSPPCSFCTGTAGLM